MVHADGLEESARYRAEERLGDLAIGASIDEGSVFITHRHPEPSIGAILARPLPNLGDRVIDVARVQAEAVGRLVADGKPIAQAEMARRPPGGRPKGLVIFVEHAAQDAGAITRQRPTPRQRIRHQISRETKPQNPWRAGRHTLDV